MSKYNNELPIIQKTYDLIVWYVPLLNKLPRDHKFNLGDRIAKGLYDLLEALLMARYSKEKLALLHSLNLKLEILRYQTRLLLDGDGGDAIRISTRGRWFGRHDRRTVCPFFVGATRITHKQGFLKNYRN